MTPTTPQPATATRPPVPREIWVLIVAALIIALGFGLIAPILPQYAASFDVGVAAASAIVTVFALTRMAFAPAAGSLIGRFGERRAYLAGLLIVALSSLMCVFAGSYLELIAWRAIGGIGSVMFTVSSMGLIVRLAPPQARGRTSALYGSAFLLGNIIGPVLGAFMAVLGYRVAFGIYAASVFLAYLVVLIFLRVNASGPTLTDERPAMTLREGLGIPDYRALLISGFANGWATFGVRIALVPLMAAHVPAIGAPMAGVSLTVMALGNVAGQQVTGRIVDARGRRPVLMVGLLIAGLATVVFGWSVSIPVFLGLSALAGFGASMIQPASQALLADIIGRDRSGGQALSTFSMASDSGAIIGTLVAGLIADAFGFGWAFTLTGVALLSSLLPWLYVSRGRGAGSASRPRPQPLHD
ncbi:MAG: MFS transporter [Propioniciclava sp.]|uniref:MFS transporter n=1 Tax=Propioniciclava sp. TaxID=2038686 RepID=UPI0039E57F7D